MHERVGKKGRKEGGCDDAFVCITVCVMRYKPCIFSNLLSRSDRNFAPSVTPLAL